MLSQKLYSILEELSGPFHNNSTKAEDLLISDGTECMVNSLKHIMNQSFLPDIGGGNKIMLKCDFLMFRC